MKKWQSILLIGVVLVLACSVVGCAPTQTTETEPTNAVSWDEAKYHIGDRATVCGPVVDTYWASGSNGKPTFLNVGKKYPDPDRFTVVIWIQNRAKFAQAPEVHYLGKTICVTGLIDEYPKGSGSAQIQVTDPSQIVETPAKPADSRSVAVGIIAAVIIVGVVGFLLIRRRAHQQNKLHQKQQ